MLVNRYWARVSLQSAFSPCRYVILLKVWLELNKIGVWWCDWEVLEVVVEGAVGDVGGEGREGFLRGGRAGVGDVVLGGVPYVFRGIVVGGVGGQVWLELNKTVFWGGFCGVPG